MDHQEEKQLIYFKDLLFSALYQWKKALILGLALAVLLGAAGFLGKQTPVSTEPISVTPENESKIEQLQANEERLKVSIERLETYMANSLLMQLNPYHCASAGFYLFVTTENDNAEEMLLYTYRSSLELTENMEALAQQFDMEPAQFQELIIYPTDDAPIYHENCVYIAVRADSLEDAVSYRDAVEKVVLGYQSSISNTVSPHSVSTYRVMSGPAVDSELMDLQNTLRQRLSSLKTELTNTQSELNKYKPSVLESSDPNPVLYAIVGGILGVCLVCVWAWLKHIGSDKVYSTRVLSNRTGVGVLGSVRSRRKRCKLDLWLRKLEGRADHTDTQAVAANIRNRCDGIQNLLLMGSFDADELGTLTSQLEQSGTHCTVCPDPAVKADALNALPGCDAVVLVETCKLSRYSNVEWAMQTVADHNKPLLGCVLIDG